MLLMAKNLAVAVGRKDCHQRRLLNDTIRLKGDRGSDLLLLASFI